MLAFSPVVLLFIFPGIFLLFLPLTTTKKISLLDAVIMVPIFSLASWIVLFGLLKFMPISFSTLLYGGMSLAILGLLYCVFKKVPLHVNLEKNEAVYLVLLSPLFFAFYQFTIDQIVPAGADMATHSYIAKAITYYDTFPTTYYPLVPIKEFGFEPIGMPSLMAAVSMLSGITIQQTAVFASALTYPFAGLLLYSFLKMFFRRYIALITVYGLFFVNYSFTSYLTFGAHPTVLSTIFITFTVYVAVHVYLSKQLTTLNSIIVAIMAGAALLTHPTPFVSMAYYVIVPTFYAVYMLRKNSQTYGFLAKTSLFFLFLVLCFLTSIKPISDDTMKYLRDWQQNRNYLANIDVSIFSVVPDYLLGRSGQVWSLLILIGFLASLRSDRKEVKWFMAALSVYGLILLNTEYWILPLSPVLYPGRATTSGVLLFCYFAAWGTDYVVNFIHTILKKTEDHTDKAIKLLLLMTIFVFFGKHVNSSLINNFPKLLTSYKNEGMVTANDLVVFDWIKNNTNESDVFLNNYGDAGVWIPAIAGRMVMNNDAAPHSFDSLAAGTADLKPTYAFVGEKLLYKEGRIVTDEVIAKNNYELVYSFGNSKVYKLP